MPEFIARETFPEHNALLLNRKYRGRDRLRLVVRNKEGDHIGGDGKERIGINVFGGLHHNTPINDQFKLPIPWGTVLEGTEYKKSDARTGTLQPTDKAKILLIHTEYDGFGKKWNLQFVDKGSEYGRLLIKSLPTHE